MGSRAFESHQLVGSFSSLRGDYLRGLKITECVLFCRYIGSIYCCILINSLMQVLYIMGTSWTNGKVTLGIALNLASAIGIVFINKFIYIRYKFPSMTLTLVHFVVTSLGIHVCAWFDVFSPKRLVIKKIIPLSAAFCGFVVFTNLSLQYNSVGTYQLAKSMTTPVILFIQAIFYNKSTSFRVKLTVVSVNRILCKYL